MKGIDFHPSLQHSIEICCRRWGIGNVSLYSRPTEAGTDATVVLPLVLHQLPVEEGLELLHIFLKQGKSVVVADYKLPERNLDYPAYWLSRIAESVGTHGTCYRAFMRCGGIEGVIGRLRLIPQRRGVLWGGGIGFLWICDRGER